MIEHHCCLYFRGRKLLLQGNKETLLGYCTSSLLPACPLETQIQHVCFILFFFSEVLLGKGKSTYGFVGVQGSQESWERLGSGQRKIVELGELI